MPLSKVEANCVAGANLLSAMSNAQRLRVLCILASREVAVGELARRVGLSQSALSQHLSKLRMAGLVTNRRDAQTIYYSCDSPAVRHILEGLAAVFTADTEAPGTA